jgi:hypothetical protein
MRLGGGIHFTLEQNHHHGRVLQARVWLMPAGLVLKYLGELVYCNDHYSITWRLVLMGMSCVEPTYFLYETQWVFTE